MEKMVIPELIVVEGIHDKQAVLEAVDANVWVIGGNRVAHRFVEELRRAAAHTDIIILTDPDGPGEQIRRRISTAIPGCKHANITRSDARKGPKVGVEYADVDVIRRALLDARQSECFTRPAEPVFHMDDLVQAGLINHPRAALRRQQVGDALHIGYGNAKAFLHKLNVLGITRDEWGQALLVLQDGSEECP